MYLELAGAAADVGVVMGRIGSEPELKNSMSVGRFSGVVKTPLRFFKTTLRKEAFHRTTEAKRGSPQS